MINLYNTLSKKIDKFKPLEDKSVRIYTCGPTIYDNAHIGNLSSFVYADTLNRLLEIKGYDVHHVMNLTDVDDKTILRSHSEFPEDSPEIALSKLADLYESIFMDDMKRVGNRVDKLEFIKATESIELMQKLIKDLYDNKFAYIADDGIYFSIETYKKSGKTYGQLLDIETSNTSQSRINNDEYDKQSVHDFALWKFMQPNEPAWSFVINDQDYLGRPGWHIECSAMSTSLLGQPFDIHTGGIDLIFPHHENEIAQSTANEKNPTYAQLFFHNEHMFIDNKKMSKSLGNVYNLKDIIEKGIEPLAFRLLVLQSHYRNQSDFTWDVLNATQNRLVNLRNIYTLRYQTINSTPGHQEIDYKQVSDIVIKALSEDLNTPIALSRISEVVNVIEGQLVGHEELNDFLEFFKLIDHLFGLDLSSTPDIDDKTKKLVVDREKAREKKDWTLSDQLRDQLKALQIGVRDTDSGSIWYKLN